MSVAPHAGIVDFGTFTSPTATADGIQGEVPKPVIGQENYVLTGVGWAPSGGGGGGGTVTSVAMSVPSLLSVAGSPITTIGTLAVSYSGTPLPVANGGFGNTDGSIDGGNY